MQLIWSAVLIYNLALGLKNTQSNHHKPALVDYVMLIFEETEATLPEEPQINYSRNITHNYS